MAAAASQANSACIDYENETPNWGGGILLIIIVLEMSLRVKFGFCDSPLCISSDKFEYICAPNQDRHRFGHHIIYNSYSQRSEELDSTRTIVLGLGDSVINGGVMTDHDELATTIASNDEIQILNISAGSWGPDNCAAYLKEYGTFGARMMLLVVSSHDAHDIMDFKPIVGIHKSFPADQYPFAIIELIDRYIIPRIFKTNNNDKDPDRQVVEGVGIVKGSGVFNPGFDQLKEAADNLEIPLCIYLHPDIEEMKAGSFNEQGEEIIAWAKQNNVSLTTGFDAGETLDGFRDGIHLNQNGQKILAKWMMHQISTCSRHPD